MSGPEQSGLEGVSVTWLSTHEFLLGVRDVSDPGSARPGCWLVTGSKTGSVEHCNYDDLCYSTGDPGTTLYRGHHITEWGVVAVVSSTSVELGVLGHSDTGYTQWILEDNARAEIPLAGAEECYPVGVGYDTTSQVSTPVGESEGPASPILYLLSSDGLLCPFYCRNYSPGAASLCAPPVLWPGDRRVGSAQLPSVTSSAAASVSPVKSVSAPAPLSSSFSFSVSGGNTSTPLTKQTPASSLFKPPADKPPPPAFNLTKDPPPAFGSAVSKDPPAFASKDPPPPFGASKEPPAFSVAVGTKQPSALSKEPSPAPVQTKTSSNSSKESTPVSDATNAKISAAIEEEHAAFLSDLETLRQSLGAGLNINIGSHEDKVNLVTRTEHCARFSRDITDTTKCQNSEIFSLRSSTLETFSWLEEAVARERSGSEHKYVQLLRARPLDPRSVRMMEKLRSQFFYCEQQIEEVRLKYF